jgi:hypothetical protein
MFRRLVVPSVRTLLASKLTPLALAAGLLGMGAMLAGKVAESITQELSDLDATRKDGMAALQALTEQVMDLDTRRQELESTVRTLMGVQERFTAAGVFGTDTPEQRLAAADPDWFATAHQARIPDTTLDDTIRENGTALDGNVDG